MPYSLEFILNVLPKPVNQQTSMHWTKKGEMVRELKRMVGYITAGKRPIKPLKKAILTLTRVSSNTPDYDGLVSSFKHIVDGLTECGIIEDDSLEHIGIPNFKHELCKPKKGFIRVKVEEA